MDIYRNIIYSLVTTITILSMVFTSLAHARKSATRAGESILSYQPETLCHPADFIRLPTPFLPGKSCLPRTFPDQQTISTTPSSQPSTWLTTKKRHCRNLQQLSRTQLIYSLLPGLPELQMELDNVSVKLDLDDSDRASLSHLMVRIGYRNCW